MIGDKKMDYKLIGFRRQKGTFTNQETGQVIDYDNVIFQAVHKPIAPGVIGEQCSDFKVPARFLEDRLKGDCIELKQLIGKNVVFDSVPYGRSVQYVDILEVN